MSDFDMTMDMDLRLKFQNWNRTWTGFGTLHLDFGSEIQILFLDLRPGDDS